MTSLKPAASKLERAEIALTIKHKKTKNEADKAAFKTLLDSVSDVLEKMEGWLAASSSFHKRSFSQFEKAAEKKKESLQQELTELLVNADNGSKEWKQVSDELKKHKVY
eukprot:3932842-Amphidinium_carterae.1